jgi:hypothetical protein
MGDRCSSTSCGNPPAEDRGLRGEEFWRLVAWHSIPTESFSEAALSVHAKEDIQRRPASTNDEPQGMI